MLKKVLLVPAVIAAAVLVYTSIANGTGEPVDAGLPGEPDTPSESLIARLPPVSDFPPLNGASGWINSPALTPEGLRGKVVLVEFWAYTCINWRRESPYVKAWASRYKDKGLVVIGVHSPEFRFEADSANVRRATQQLGITYPVAVDSNLAIWSAFGNNYWPALYFIDSKGRIRGQHFGEGEYDRSERLIRQLLAESGAADLGNELTTVDPNGLELAADLHSLMSPESYLGYERQRGFASPGGLSADQTRIYTQPEDLRLNHWALSGEWTARDESVASIGAGARLAYEFHARDVNLVMGPSKPGVARSFRVLIDGKPPGDARGADVDERGTGVMVEPRLYQLIRQHGAISNHRFEIEFLDPGAEAYDFTFG